MKTTELHEEIAIAIAAAYGGDHYGFTCQRAAVAVTAIVAPRLFMTDVLAKKLFIEEEKRNELAILGYQNGELRKALTKAIQLLEESEVMMPDTYRMNSREIHEAESALHAERLQRADEIARMRQVLALA